MMFILCQDLQGISTSRDFMLQGSYCYVPILMTMTCAIVKADEKQKNSLSMALSFLHTSSVFAVTKLVSAVAMWLHVGLLDGIRNCHPAVGNGTTIVPVILLSLLYGLQVRDPAADKISNTLVHRGLTRLAMLVVGIVIFYSFRTRQGLVPCQDVSFNFYSIRLVAYSDKIGDDVDTDEIFWARIVFIPLLRLLYATSAALSWQEALSKSTQKNSSHVMCVQAVVILSCAAAGQGSAVREHSINLWCIMLPLAAGVCVITSETSWSWLDTKIRSTH